MDTLEDFFAKKRKQYKKYKKKKKFKTLKKVGKSINKGSKALSDETSMLKIFR